MEPHRGVYPPDWNAIATRLKERVGRRCERCRHADDYYSGYVLTVAHLDNNKSNCERWNLVALCQRCHLHIQGTVDLRQGWLFPLPAWMRWRYRGWLKAHARANEGARAHGESGVDTDETAGATVVEAGTDQPRNVPA